MSDTALQQLEAAGYFMAGFITADSEHAWEAETVRDMLIEALDAFLECGEFSGELTGKPVLDVWRDLAREAAGRYEHAAAPESA